MRRIDQTGGRHDRIRARCRSQKLLEKGYPATLKSMQSIGYRQMADFLEGRLPFEEAVRVMKRDTRRYAKRQLTWFTADPDVHWLAPDQIGDMEMRVDEFLESS